ncbi:MAG: glutaredoxin [Bacteriovoracaceae bacterium]|jgi:glutaredoxin|nr:glutaredoxin [Bacteriovoracaceae bacterium]
MKAKVFRMVTDKHICPFGIKSLDLLKKEKIDFEDVHLSSRDEIDAFKNKYDVKTTPQIFIDGKRIGGYEELVKYFGRKTLKQEGTTYQPIIAVFFSTFLMSIAFQWTSNGVLVYSDVLKSFVAISMCVLAILKLRDLYSFSNQFITYDILARKIIGYSYIYPFAELFAGILMLAGFLTNSVAIISIFIGLVGSVSVIKAVYVDKRDIKCACVGGDSNVPLGAVSLIENVMMLAVGLSMLI